MSHTTTLKSVVIRDVSALRSAIEALRQEGVNCELREGAKPRMYYGNQHGKCDYVLHLGDSPYDVGFDRQKDGSYVPVFDEFARHVAKQIGAACPLPDTAEGRIQHQIGKFMQLYSMNAARNAALAQGYMVESMTTDADGNIHMTLGGM